MVDVPTGNIYFRVNHLERYIDGHREFDVQLDFSRFVLSGAPPDPSGNDWNDELDITEEMLQERAEREGEDDDGWMGKNKKRKATRRKSQITDLAEQTEQHVPKHPFVDQKPLEGEDLETARVIDYDEDGVPELAQPAEPKAGSDKARWCVAGCSDVSYCFGSSLEQQAAMRDALIAAKEARHRAEGQVRVGGRHATDWIVEKEKYRFHLDQPVGTLEKRKSSNKLQYVLRSLARDLGLHNPRSLEFVASLIMCIVIFFVRIYIHYIGEYLLLKIENVVVNSFEFEGDGGSTDSSAEDGFRFADETRL